MQNSVAEHNGRFGITASFTVGGRVENDVVAFNNSPSNPPGYSGATHFTNTRDLQVVGNSVHDNYGRGIWFDIDSEDALVQGNTVVGQLDTPTPTTPTPSGTGMRIEISCDITVAGNTVSGNQGPQIAVDGSDRTLVTGNTANAPAGQPGIRVAPQDRALVPARQPQLRRRASDGHRRRRHGQHDHPAGSQPRFGLRRGAAEQGFERYEWHDVRRQHVSREQLRGQAVALVDRLGRREGEFRLVPSQLPPGGRRSLRDALIHPAVQYHTARVDARVTRPSPIHLR